MPQDRSHRPDQTGSIPGSGQSDKGGTYFLGRYRVVDEIGIGGMATVHLARMDGLGGFQKWVAIKKIHAHLLEDESFVQMFLDEARIVARIQHANVASVFELGRHEDCYWIAMEYLHGEPLRELMRRNEELGTPMPPEIACRVIADAAEGLHAAHELTGKSGEKLQLVHRDVTPHNLFVTYDGTTKVVDFGIAKFASRVSNTRAGTLKGKLAYMSPEQVHGEPIDRRTDLFALGVVLWELTTGQRLFRMDSDLDTLAKVQECNVPRPSTLVRGYPLDLEKIVMKVLARNRNERFKTARELSRALQSFLMRRGLFVASDEVATYVQSIFAERIQKREAHLRWAAEVTQTINIDSLRIEDSGLPAAHFEPPPQQPAQPEPKMMPARLPPPRPAAGKPPPQAQRMLEAPSLPTPATNLRPYDDGPTLQGELPDFGYEGGDDFDDNDDTLVAQARGETAALQAAMLANDEAARARANAALPGIPQKTLPLPAAGRPVDAFQTSLVGPNPPPPQGASFPSVPLQSSFPGDFAHAPTMPAQPNPFLPDPAGGGPRWQASMVPGDPARSQILGAGAPMGGPAAPGPVGFPMPPPDRENRTITAKGLKQGIPMWVVASIAGVLALVLVGAIYMVFLGRAPSGRIAATASATAPPGSATGPFGSAREAFDTAIAPKPTPIVDQRTEPAVSASAASAPVVTAAPTASAAPANSTASAGSSGAATTPVKAPKTETRPEPKPDTKHDGPVELPSRKPDKTEKTGLLTVICKPACDEATDNGRAFDPSTPRQSVAAGEHHLVLKTSNPPVTRTQTVTVSPGDLTITRAVMTP